MQTNTFRDAGFTILGLGLRIVAFFVVYLRQSCISAIQCKLLIQMLPFALLLVCPSISQSFCMAGTQPRVR